MKARKNKCIKKELTTQEAYLQEHKKHHHFVTIPYTLLFFH